MVYFSWYRALLVNNLSKADSIDYLENVLSHLDVNKTVNLPYKIKCKLC